MRALTVKNCLAMRTLPRTGLMGLVWCLWTYKRSAAVLGGKERQFDMCARVCMALTRCATRMGARTRGSKEASVSARL